MIKNSKVLIYFLILLFTKTVLASTSSSYLISQTAFNNHDFTKVLYEYNTNHKNYNKNDYLDELISAVVTENLIVAEKIAAKIFLIDSSNQEARLVKLVKAFNEKKENEINVLRFDEYKNKNDLFEFLFFLEDKIKSKNEISNSFLEIVKSSYSDSDSKYSKNYNFLMFYTSLSILIDQDNYEAIFIKGQLLQMINDYFFAEKMYLKIPNKSEYFLDAQRNIAFNYSKTNKVLDAENKIIKLIQKNENDYQLTKILADFYRIEKKYDKAINIYSSLIQQDHSDSWFIIYLRGICYERSGNWQKAEIDFLKSLEIKSNSPNVLNYLAYGWIERNQKIQQSFEMLTKAYEANPDSYYILDSLAWAHYKKKEYKKAAELMEKVIDMVPGEAISLDHLGDIYLAMNRKREAIYFWKQAKDLAEPEDEITEKVKEKLRLHNAS